MILRHSLILIAVLVFASTASAGELELKPGLWAVTNKMAAAGGQMGAAQAELQKQLAAVPPEQRKMMEAMMARQGLKLDAAGPLEVSGRICMTQQMIDQHELPVQQGSCKTTLQSRTGNEMKMSFTCTDPPASGEGRYTIVNAEAYTMKMDIKTSIAGSPEKVTIDAAGKWLGADCGAVKPDNWSTSSN